MSFSENNKISNFGKMCVHANKPTMLFIRALYVAHEKVDSKKPEFYCACGSFKQQKRSASKSFGEVCPLNFQHVEFVHTLLIFANFSRTQIPNSDKNVLLVL